MRTAAGCHGVAIRMWEVRLQWTRPRGDTTTIRSNVDLIRRMEGARLWWNAGADFSNLSRDWLIQLQGPSVPHPPLVRSSYAADSNASPHSHAEIVLRFIAAVGSCFVRGGRTDR